MLLSTLEIAKVCQEQHNAYVTALGRPDLAEDWNEISIEDQESASRAVAAIIAGEKPNAPDTSNVMKISFALYKAMVTSLSEL